MKSSLEWALFDPMLHGLLLLRRISPCCHCEIDEVNRNDRSRSSSGTNGLLTLNVTALY
jgi:hypothetical protein